MADESNPTSIVGDAELDDDENENENRQMSNDAQEKNITQSGSGKEEAWGSEKTSSETAGPSMARRPTSVEIVDDLDRRIARKQAAVSISNLKNTGDQDVPLSVGTSDEDASPSVGASDEIVNNLDRRISRKQASVLDRNYHEDEVDGSLPLSSPGSVAVRKSMDERIARKSSKLQAPATAQSAGNTTEEHTSAETTAVGPGALAVSRSMDARRERKSAESLSARKSSRQLSSEADSINTPITPGALAAHRSMERRRQHKSARNSAFSGCEGDSERALSTRTVVSLGSSDNDEGHEQRETNGEDSPIITKQVPLPRSSQPDLPNSNGSTTQSSVRGGGSVTFFLPETPAVMEEGSGGDFGDEAHVATVNLGTPLSATRVGDTSRTANGTMSRLEREQTVRQIMMDNAIDVEGEIVEPRSSLGSKEMSRTGFCLRHRRMLLILLCLVVLAVVATVVGVLVSSSDDSGKTASSETTPEESVSSAPSPLPTTFPTPAATSERFSAIKSVLQSVTSADVLEDPTSPQYKALAWLADEDSRALDWAETEKLVQRYAIATLYFATGGEDSWIQKCNFLSQEHECNWNEAIDHKRVTQLGVNCTNDSQTVDFIDLFENNLTGTLPDEIETLDGLWYYDVSTNELTGSLSWHIEKLPKTVRELYLYVNHFTSSIPHSIGNFSDLEELWLNGNELTNTLPKSLNNLSSLKTLLLTTNGFNGTLPFTNGTLEKLSFLALDDNDLTGTLPLTLFTLPRLDHLMLGKNMFNGTLPLEVGELELLVQLDVGHNLFTGFLPSTLADLGKLTYLSIEKNSFNGTIPSEIGSLTNMFLLNFQHNLLSGEIPETMENMTAMVIAGLANNLLNGSVPSGFSNLPLYILTLENNTLSGSLEFLCNNSWGYLSSDCYEHNDTQEIACQCCNTCCSDHIKSEIPDIDFCFPNG